MTARPTEVFIQISVNASEATIALHHAAEALGATTLRWLKREYEDAGAPYGLDMDGFKQWLVEQGHGSIVASWDAHDR